MPVTNSVAYGTKPTYTNANEFSRDHTHKCALNMANAAAFATGNYALLRGAIHDRLHQPYRKHLIPGYDELELAAHNAGALGFFLSGSGSTVIALTDSAAVAKKLPRQLCDIFKKHRIQSRALLLRAHSETLHI